jgi:hypothetical protein
MPHLRDELRLLHGIAPMTGLEYLYDFMADFPILPHLENLASHKFLFV